MVTFKRNNTIVESLTEEDIENLREYADVHIVYRKTGNYKIFSNKGISLGEIIKNKDKPETYNLKVFDNNYDKFLNCTQTNKEIQKLIISAKKITQMKKLEGRVPNFYVKPKIIRSNKNGRIFIPTGKSNEYEMNYSEKIYGTLYSKKKIIRMMPSKNFSYYQKVAGFY